MTATNTRMLIFHTGAVAAKATKDSQGVGVMTLRKGHFVASVKLFVEGMVANASRFKARNLPAAGALPKAEDVGEQLQF